MARVAFLLPRDEMLEPATKMAEKYHLQTTDISAVHTSNLLRKVETVMEEGVDIIIARGVQAMMIRSACPVPVIEIRLTGLEIATLVTKARNMVKKAHPTIGLVGFANMFSDVSQISNLFDVDLLTVFASGNDELRAAAEKAVHAGADVLIGGNEVCSCAAGLQIPSVFLESGEESMEVACRSAQSLAYAVDMEKQNTAEFKAILDYTFSGIIQVDADGSIGHVNHSAEQILDKTAEELEGKSVSAVIPALSDELLAPVFAEGKELYSLHIKLRKNSVMASVAPIAREGVTIGAIISLNEARQVKLYNAEQRAELVSQGFVARSNFDDLVVRSQKMQNVLNQAKHFAKFNAPVLLLGEYGTEKSELAQCIHNAGEFSESAFIRYDCAGHSEAEALADLFGPEGLTHKAQGTLYLSEVSALSPALQYRVCRLIAPVPGGEGDFGAGLERLRIIASDSGELEALVEQGLFSRDLYYALNVMTLTVPPLRERPEDVQRWAEYYLQELQKSYGRYIHLSRDAWRVMTKAPWSGNLAELFNVCKRLVVCSPKRSVDEFFLRQQIVDTQTDLKQVPAVALPGTYNGKLMQLPGLLEKFGGNRTAVANELGISKTTLWRYMKKLDLNG